MTRAPFQPDAKEEPAPPGGVKEEPAPPGGVKEAPAPAGGDFLSRDFLCMPVKRWLLLLVALGVIMLGFGIAGNVSGSEAGVRPPPPPPPPLPPPSPSDDDSPAKKVAPQLDFRSLGKVCWITRVKTCRWREPGADVCNVERRFFFTAPGAMSGVEDVDSYRLRKLAFCREAATDAEKECKEMTHENKDMDRSMCEWPVDVFASAPGPCADGQPFDKKFECWAPADGAEGINATAYQCANEQCFKVLPPEYSARVAKKGTYWVVVCNALLLAFGGCCACLGQAAQSEQDCCRDDCCRNCCRSVNFAADLTSCCQECSILVSECLHCCGYTTVQPAMGHGDAARESSKAHERKQSYDV